MDVEAAPPRPWALVGERNFGSLLLGQLVSSFGDRITVIALAVLVWEATGSSLYTALAVIVATVPPAIFGFFAGALADALGRQRTMIACDLVRAVMVGFIPFVFILGLPLPTIYGLVLVATLCTAVFNPARLAIIPDLVGRGDLGRANSISQVSDRSVEIVGSAAAGVLVALLGTSVFFVDAVTFFFSALMISRIALATPEPIRALSPRALLQDAGTGLRVIRDSAVLLLNTAFSLIAQISLAVVATLTPVFLLRDLRGPRESFGFSEAAIAVGAVLAGLLMPTVMARVRKGHLVVLGFASFGVVLVVLGLTRSVEVAIGLFALVGAANVLFLIPNITIWHEAIPPSVRGRATGARLALLNLAWLPVMVAGGALAETFSAAALITVAGAFTLVTALVGLFIPAVRDVS